MSDGTNPVRTRFAPSPTGFMHVGGVRTALFAWLVARQAKGQFLLRIEDTDKTREVAGSEAHIMECLKWLGLDWDEGPDKGGPQAPYRQSERLDIYKQWAQKLIKAGRAYADPYSSEELESFRQQAKAEKRPFLFREHRPENPPTWEGKTPLRFKSEPKDYQWHDEVMGDLSSGPEVVDDFILIKSDGYPTYNFAHIIDDHLMGVTHVIRSQEFLSSVPKFLDLYEALQVPRPIFATLPYVLGPDGKKKLSKRDGAKDILDYRQQGYLPEALTSFLATLGWNDGTTQEIFSQEELVSKFSLERVQRSGAKFDEQRLEWVNGHFIRRLEIGDLYEAARAYWPKTAETFSFEYKLQVLKLLQERLKYLAELPELSRFFFEKDYTLSKELIESSAKALGDPKDTLVSVRQELEQSDFSEDDLKERLWMLNTTLGTKPRDLFGLIRVAVTGRTVAPGIWETLHALGKAETLARLEQAEAALGT